jgi:hypothetical protein
VILKLNQRHAEPRHFALEGQDLPAAGSSEFADQHVWEIEVAGWVRAEGVGYKSP